MSKLPYGGVSKNDPEYEADAGWTKLDTVAEHLEAGEALPPFLAYWLGNAIERAGRDPNELLRLLELKPRRGRPRHRFTAKEAWDYGARICELEEAGLNPNEAVKAVLESLCGEGPSRTMLQKWRDQYRLAMEEAEAATK